MYSITIERFSHKYSRFTSFPLTTAQVVAMKSRHRLTIPCKEIK